MASERMRFEHYRDELAGWYIEHKDGTADAHGVRPVVREGIEGEAWEFDCRVLWPDWDGPPNLYFPRDTRSIEVGRK